jgi:ABC-2 type transport system ATP-binding protein
LTFECPDERAGQVEIGVTQSSAHPVFCVARQLHLASGETSIHCTIANLPLPLGRFTLWVGVRGGMKRDLLPWHRVASFQVKGPRLDPPPRGVVRAAPVLVSAEWNIRSMKE